MLAQSDASSGRRARLLPTLLILIALVWCVEGPRITWAQEPAVTAEEPETPENADQIWSEITRRYSVVVLSRGLLLEPLGDAVEMRTIEIVDDSVAIDGETVGADELRQRVGAEEADLVLQLAAMDRTERRLLFESAERGEVVVALGEAAAPEEPESTGEQRYRDTQVSVGSKLTVEKDELAKEALVFGGPLYVYGTVTGDAVAIGGPVTISGKVTGDVAAVGGNLTLEAGAEVLGDVVSVGGEVDIDEEARVRGQIIEVPFGPNLSFSAWPSAIFGGRMRRPDLDDIEISPWGVAGGFLWEGFKLLVLGLLACLVMLVAREPLERVRRKAAAEPWKSGLVGLLVQILFLPLLVLVTLILVISIIGIPLVLLVPFFVLALILLAFLGYSGVALGIGDFLKRRFNWHVENPYLVLLIGVLAIQICSIIGDLLDFGWGPVWFFAVMFGVLGALIKYVAWTVGLGATFLTRFGTAEGWGGGAALSYAPADPSPTEVAVPPRSESSQPAAGEFSSSGTQSSAPESDEPDREI